MCDGVVHIAAGKLSKAADRLKVDKLRLQRVIDRSPRLQRLHKELYEVYVHDSAEARIRCDICGGSSGSVCGGDEGFEQQGGGGASV